MRRGVTLHPGYLLGTGEGVVEARDVGHDGLFVRTGSAHDVCERREGGDGVWMEGCRWLNRAHNKTDKQEVQPWEQLNIKHLNELEEKVICFEGSG